ncbi:MAG TPA: hypothetical protein VM680_20205 [Verrucomicrobiae bacterium]|nr:hypothetical protein [Verrucomicrobiae bacterium]
MFSLFKKKTGPPPETTPTFKTRVKTFWDWFPSQAARFSQSIENRTSAELAEEVSARVDQLLPGAAWEFSANPNGPGHAFVLTGEGNLHLQLLTQFWHKHAPSIPGWAFFPARQPGPLRHSTLVINEREFAASAFWLVPSIDAENERIDITVWHPDFPHFDDRTRWTVLFLFLDQVLGEYGTQQSIGKITFGAEQLGNAISISEMSDFVSKATAEHGWTRLPPGESASLYTAENPQSRFLRDDIISGTTVNMPLITEYARSSGQLANPIPDTGADYVFVAINSNRFPSGQQVMARGEIEDALDLALNTHSTGRLIGGAFGTKNAYIDLLMFDGDNTIELIRKTFADLPITRGATLHYFAHEKRGYKLPL